jgi:arginine:ornithine antiporter/lysine permease
VLDRGDIAVMRQPSVASVLEAVVGPWGAIFVSVGLIVSVLGAYLAWSLICIEVLFAAARSGDMPRIFARENGNGVPSTALWLSNAVIQLFLISTLFSQDAFTLMLKLTSSMVLVPYLLAAAYGLLVAARGDSYDVRPDERTRDLIAAAVATLYAAFLIYAADMKFLLLAAVLYAPGTALYVRVRREQKLPLFTPIEWLVFVAASVGCIVGVYGLLTGGITI